MTTATVRSVVERFVKSSVPEILVLKGQWGVGKTYAWNKLIRELRDTAALPNYSYVSLFGVRSIPELRVEIFAMMRPVKTLGEKLSATAINENWLKLALNGVKSFAPFLKRAGVGQHITVGVETVAQLFISNTLICLDDFERMDDSLADGLLGLVSSLKEEKNCKVILIFNEQQLNEKTKSYEKYREKLVDIELEFSPLADEAADLVFDGKAAWHADVRRHTVAWDINNIRILRKMERLISLIRDKVGKFHNGVVAQAISSTVLLVCCYYERDKDRPTIEFLRHFSSFEAAFERVAAKKEGEAEDPKEAEWKRLLDSYGFNNMDEFDLAILQVVEKGFVEETNLVTRAKVLDGQFEARDLDQSFTKAWELYHNTFENNEEILVTTLREAFKKSVKQITPLNLDGTVTLLRKLGEDAIADELIDYYIEQHKDDPKRFDLEGYAFSGDVTDKAIREKFDEHHKLAHPVPTLAEAAQDLAADFSWTAAQEEAMEAATEQQLYELFKQDHGKNLSRIVKACLRLGGVAGHQEFGQRVRATLGRIAEESKLNADRVRRYLK